MIKEPPLPFDIDVDWNRVRKIYQKIIDNYHQGFFEKTTSWVNEHYAYGADLGEHGRLSISTSLTNGVNWYIWTGSFLERLLPFSERLKYQFQKDNINFCNFAYMQHTTDIAKHIDGNIDPLIKQCNLNYIVAADDTNATSYFQDSSGIHSYPSTPGKAWLINNSVDHWVDNQNFREVFQIRFHDSYDRVKQYLTDNPLNLTC